MNTVDNCTSTLNLSSPLPVLWCYDIVQLLLSHYPLKEEYAMLQRKTSLVLYLMLVIAAFSFAQQVGASGSVSISYKLSRLFKIASNQYAIWIETDSGSFLRTLMVTNFTAKKGGWKIRPQSIPRWVKSANVANLKQGEVDAVSGPTQSSGSYSAVWDLKDSKGKTVPPGTYKYLVEGSISWDKEVLWSGTIVIGGPPQISQATATYKPDDAQRSGTLILEVTASYTP
jgi:hypothetical protein